MHAEKDILHRLIVLMRHIRKGPKLGLVQTAARREMEFEEELSLLDGPGKKPGQKPVDASLREDLAT